MNKRSVPVRFYNYSDRPVTIYKDRSVGEFCPAVESGQTIPTARHATTGLRPFLMTVIKGQQQQSLLFTHLHSTATHYHLKRSRIGIHDMKKLFPIDNDRITEDQKLNVWRIMANHSKAVSRDHTTLATALRRNFESTRNLRPLQDYRCAVSHQHKRST